jgi:hypothetical protein
VRPGVSAFRRVLSAGMDPDVNIADQRILTSRLLNEPDDLTARYDLGELHQALEDSLANGGAEPSDADWRDVQRRSGALMYKPK